MYNLTVKVSDGAGSQYPTTPTPVKNENNVSKACILTVFKTIWNCREHFINNFFKACALNVFETIWNCRELYENNVHLKHAL